jgi:hypothetical protein
MVAFRVGGVVVFAGARDDAAVAAPPLPQAATASAVTGSTAALTTTVISLVRVMSLLRFGEIDGRSQRR